ncbi:hypothetical protein ACFRNJ_31320 [Streptomyces sp. NPDC056721]|uniref:hypothetical protein n=1 Tax=Streptomyces sp. NPDC056721 TaxID=3345923 RepID=UPI00368A0D4E
MDVKPYRRLTLPEVAATFAWTRRAVEARGWRYEVWSGPSAQLLENIRFLAGLRSGLNTNTAHVMYLLSGHPIDWSPPLFRRTQHTATRIRQWRTWYEQGHLSLQDIADREGTSLATVRLAFLKNDVPLRPAGSYPGRPRRR